MRYRLSLWMMPGAAKGRGAVRSAARARREAAGGRAARPAVRCEGRGRRIDLRESAGHVCVRKAVVHGRDGATGRG